MSKVTIDRELLERLLYSNSPARFDATEYNAARAELFSILAQPAQQGEAVEVVAWRMWNGKTWRFCYSSDHAKNGWEPLMTVAQHQRILAALSAQQPEPGRVSVPVELLEDLRDLAADAVEHHRAAYAGYKQDRQARMDKAVAESSALLASAEGVKA